MIRRIGIIARLDDLGPGKRRWFINPDAVDDFHPGYSVEEGDLLCDPSDLPEDQIVTFEASDGGRASYVELLSADDDPHAIRAALNSIQPRIWMEVLPRAMEMLSKEETARWASGKASHLINRPHLLGKIPIYILLEEAARPLWDALSRMNRLQLLKEAVQSSNNVLPPAILHEAWVNVVIGLALDCPDFQAAFDQVPPTVLADNRVNEYLKSQDGHYPVSAPRLPLSEAVLSDPSMSQSSLLVQARETWIWQVPTPQGEIVENFATAGTSTPPVIVPPAIIEFFEQHVAKPLPPVIVPPAIIEFFEQHVAKPFEKHLQTRSWVVEVTNKKDESYHRDQLAGKGQADFDIPHNLLSPADRVLVYCYYYLQMHAASTLHIYDRALRYSGLGLAPHTVYVNFGCGPLTLAVGLAWLHHLRLPPGEPASQLRLHYVGIEKSERMIERAKYFLENGELFHTKATFRFIRSFYPTDSLCSEIDALLPSPGVKTDIVLNLCYFVASSSVDVTDLDAAVRTVLRKYPSQRVWLVFQNPYHHWSKQKWESLKLKFPEFRLLAGGEEKIGYTNTTNRRTAWEAKLCHEVLVRDPVGAAASPSQPAAPQVEGKRAWTKRTTSRPPAAAPGLEEEIPF